MPPRNVHIFQWQDCKYLSRWHEMNMFLSGIYVKTVQTWVGIRWVFFCIIITGIGVWFFVACNTWNIVLFYKSEWWFICRYFIFINSFFGIIFFSLWSICSRRVPTKMPLWTVPILNFSLRFSFTWYHRNVRVRTLQHLYSLVIRLSHFLNVWRHTEWVSPGYFIYKSKRHNTAHW